ncbi:hypothetical protein BC834DRAFT_539611 [Gloeopeniophorella convolvens]|nr:hypothetical protein BC834DRAFT_539611 [Gloeopeniophorella convolvens]
MAANLERKWRNQFVFMQDQVMPADDEGQDAKQKKRKVPDVPSKAGPPAKKAAVSTASSSRPTVVVKRDGKSSATTVKDSKSDSSFFSAPKQKARLPSFKKAPTPTATPAAKKEPPHNIAQPSATDAFQEALKDMARARKPSPAAPVAPAGNAVTVPPPAPVIIKPLKKKKSVTWAPDGQLELVKLIERAVYDDDPVDVSAFFLSIFVPYINYVLRLLIYRVCRTHSTMYVNWTEARVLPYMPTCSRSSLIGPSHNSSIFLRTSTRAPVAKTAKNAGLRSSASSQLSARFTTRSRSRIPPRSCLRHWRSLRNRLTRAW